MLLWATLIAVSQPAKLVIINGDAPATVVDYPSMRKCEEAAGVLLAAAKANERPLPPNVVAIRRRIGAYCIPG